MTVISCGTVIRSSKYMLIGRPTNHKYWNIPKGRMDNGETFLNTALRETKEETGIDLSLLLDDISNAKFLGYFKYYKKKDLVLYDIRFKDDTLPDIKNIKCRSMFYNKKYDIYQPEFDLFMYIPLKDYGNYMTKSLVKVFDQIEFDGVAEIDRR